MHLRLGSSITREPELAKKICEAATDTLEYLDDQLGFSGLSTTIDVIPMGESHHRRGTILARNPKLHLGAPEFDSLKRTIHNIVDLAAHEGYHAVNFWLGRSEAAKNEQSAYYFGLCAQLVVLGGIELQDLPGYTLSNKLSSSRAAEHVQKNVRSLLSKEGEIIAGSQEAESILSHCRLPL